MAASCLTRVHAPSRASRPPCLSRLPWAESTQALNRSTRSLQHSQRLCIVRSAGLVGENPAVLSEGYVTLGLAQCYVKTEEGKLEPKLVIEPIAAGSLECMANGAKTSMKCVTSTRVNDAMMRDRSVLPDEFAGGMFCENFEARLHAASRTWNRPHAQDNLMDLVPLGTVRSDFNFNTEDKRVLNLDNVVTDDDNIKQDMSIDVYGRKKDEEETSPASTAAPAAKEEDSDDVDALLAL